MRSILTGLALAGAALLAQPAGASVLVTMTEAPGGVALMGGGSLNLAGLSYVDGYPYGSAILLPSQGTATLGLTNVGEFFYKGYTGPTSFGSGGFKNASSATGTYFGIGDSGRLVVRSDYSSGSPISATAFYAGETLLSLGVSVGTYTWTWGSGDTADSFTLQIVPEPASIALLGLPLAATLIRRRSGTGGPKGRPVCAQAGRSLAAQRCGECTQNQ